MDPLDQVPVHKDVYDGEESEVPEPSLIQPNQEEYAPIFFAQEIVAHVSFIDMLSGKEKNRIKKDGEIVMSSTKTRTQKGNIEDELGKLQVEKAHGVFVSLALNMLEERAHVACKEIPTLENQMGDVANDLIASTVGGVSQLICGHPFDTIKVKLQRQPVPLPGQAPKFFGAIDTVKQTIAREGIGGLFKGMGAPLATVAALNAILFTARGQMEALLRSEPDSPLTINQQLICGTGDGVAVAFTACPTESIKCRLQDQSAMAETGSAGVAVKYAWPIDVARHVYQTAGARGLFRGLVPSYTST